ncbi:MAG: hypothetical protein AAGC73_09295 [Verrucomicrobiota bacterium]
MKWLLLVIAIVLGAFAGYFLGSEGGTSSGRPSPSADAKSKPSMVGKITETAQAESSEGAALSQVEPASIELENYLRSVGEESSFEMIGSLHTLLKNASSTDFIRLMDDMKGQQYGQNWAALNLIAMRWAQVDPEGMFAYANADDERYNWGIRNSLFEAWATSDPEAALAAAATIESPNARRHVMRSVLSVIAKTDPERAVSELQAEVGNNANQTWIYNSIFSQWANSDPERARQAALDLPDGQAKVSALSGALNEWLARDATAAIEWLDSLPSDSTSYFARREVFRNIVRQNFEAAREYVDSREDPVERRKILENFYMGNMSYNKSLDEVVEVFEWMSSVTTGQLYDRKVQDAVRAIAEMDPEKAKAFVLQMPIGNGRRNALGSIGSVLAERDPQAALDFAQSLEFEDERRQVLSNMSWRLARGDVESAGQMILESNDPLIEKQLGSNLVDEWSIYNREAAFAFANLLTDPDAKSNAIQRIVKNWMQSEPAEAMDYLETQVTDENKQRNYLRNAFNDWSRQDPAEAAVWLAELPESAQKFESDLYRTVAQSYLNHDPYAASEWIGTLNDGDARDRSVQALVDNIHRNDPESAFIWAGTIDDAKQRKNSLERTVREWSMKDPDTAYEALMDAKIEAADKEPLFKIIENNRKQP